MRNPDRIDRILKALGELWKQLPDWRLGQLIDNMNHTTGRDLFYIEDDEIEELIETYKKEWRRI
jgi:hypothetical protein